MTGTAAFFFGAAVLFLLLSVVWAKQRFGHFEHLPQHYDWRGKATRLGPPSLIIWGLPLIDIAIMIAIAALFVFVPRELQNGDPTTGMVFASLVIAGSHVFILWLTDRWARAQG